MQFLKQTILLLLVAAFTNAHAQTNSLPIQAISIEAGKTGAVFGISYDQKSSTSMGFRFIANSNFGKSVNLWSLGFGAYKLIGKHKRFFELGLDFSYLHVDVISDDQFRFGNLVMPNDRTRSLYTNFNIGYRAYVANTLFRVGLAPGFYNKGFLPGAYISLGWRL